jgi:hypothetical protein
MDYYVAIKKNDILSFVAKWMEFCRPFDPSISPSFFFFYFKGYLGC